MKKLAIGVYIEDLGDNDHVLTEVKTDCTGVEMFVSLAAIAQYIHDDPKLRKWLPEIREYLETENQELLQS